MLTLQFIEWAKVFRLIGIGNLWVDLLGRKREERECAANLMIMIRKRDFGKFPAKLFQQQTFHLFN